MEICDKCGQEIKNKIKKRKTMDIWRSINELLGIDFDKYEETIRGIHNQKDLIKLENAIKKLKQGIPPTKEGATEK